MFYAESIPVVPPRSGPALAAKSARLADGRSLGLFRERGGRAAEPGGDSRGVWRGTERTAAVRSVADDEAVGLRVLHGGVQFPEDPETDSGRYPVYGIGGGQRTRLSHEDGFPG